MSRTFLGVERSVTHRRWLDRIDAKRLRSSFAIAQRYDLPEFLARVLAGRDVLPETCENFLAPSLRISLPDPLILRDMDLAVSCIARAVKEGKPLAIFGDYDVDGATSSALLLRFLRMVGGNVTRIYIPDRIREGYGPNQGAFESIAAEGARLIVCVDCGTSLSTAFDWARDEGIDVIVFDHHQAGVTLPPVLALVNPARQDDLSALGHLCAAGVVFLAIVGINRLLRESGWFQCDRQEPDLLSLLDIVALGTVCDMVPLIGVNRAFVTKGLLAMRRGLNPGLSALAMKASLQFPPNVQTLGFVFGPRINAGGRLGRAHLGARLLSSSDLNEVQEIAVTLERMNKERREIEQEILEEALAEAMYLMNMDPDMSLILIGKENWHPGVMGLIASRLKDHFCRPAIVLSFDHNGNGVGSGRSVPGLDLGRAVRAAVDAGLLVKGGGHSMAVGLSVKKVNLENLRTFLKEFLLCSGGENQGIDELICDGALTAGAAVPELIKSLETVGPFGIGNPEPCFVFPSHRLSGVRIVGKVHLRCLVKGKDGGSVKAILYHSVSTPLGRFLLEHSGRLPVHVAGFLGIDYWGGTCRAQLRIVDVAEVPEK